MDSVTLTKADVSRIIAEVASSLAGILRLLQLSTQPHKALGIWRARETRVENDLCALAAHPHLSSKSRGILDRGFRAVSHQIDRMQKEARRLASRTDAVSTPSVQAEKLARNTEAAQMLRKHLDHIRHELEEYYAAIALSHAFTISGGDRGARDTVRPAVSENSIPPTSGAWT